MPRIVAAADAGIIRSHGSTLLDQLKYPAGFPHTSYANAQAPKGGTVRLAGTGGFNSFNPFIVKGDPVNLAPFVYDTLLHSALDEPSAAYGLLAEWIEHPRDYSWVAFKIRDAARWHDGRPVTAADAVFTFRILTTRGKPFYRAYYANISAAADVGGNIVRFQFDRTGNRELPHVVGQLYVLPEHWWSGRDFAESSLERPLGSGPYRVGAFEANRFVTFERVSDYWGATLPVRLGHNNFGTVRIDYYRDAAAAFEAFKAGAIDFRRENQAARWDTGYRFPAMERGAVVRQEFSPAGPQPVQGFVFNLRRKRFADLRVRQALDLAFDFSWIQRTIYSNQYDRPRSFFQGVDDLMPAGVPTGNELALLEPFRGQVPEAVFGAAFTPHITDGSGRIRRELRTATRLLAEAGWTVVDGALVDAAGAPFTIEFLTPQADQLRAVGPYLENLRLLGIDATARVVDGPQYFNRRNAYEFDMLVNVWANSESPGNEQRDFWGSAVADQPGGRNLAGVRDAAVDALIERIAFAPNRPQLASACRALDRVLTHSRYGIMQLFAPLDRLAYWNRFGHPEPLPSHSDGFPSAWWWDQEQAGAAGGRGT